MAIAERLMARTGEQFLAGLAASNREIWIEGERVSNPLDHPRLARGAREIARVFDLQHERPTRCSTPRRSTADAAACRTSSRAHGKTSNGDDARSS